MLTGKVHNSLKKPADFVATLVRTTHLWAEGRSTRVSHRWELHRQMIEVGGEVEVENLSLEVPCLPASYHGGLLTNPEWEKRLREFNVGNKPLWFTKRRTDPCVFWYTLSVGVDVPQSKFDLEKKFPFTVTTVPAVVIATAVAIAPAPEVMGRNEDDNEPPTYNDNEPPTYLPPKYANAVPLDVIVVKADAVTWKESPNDGAVSTQEPRDKSANACSNLAYKPEYCVLRE